MCHAPLPSASWVGLALHRKCRCALRGRPGTMELQGDGVALTTLQRRESPDCDSIFTSEPTGDGTDGGTSEPVSSKKTKEDKSKKRKCKICLKLFLEEEFPVNSPYCREDKRAVDNLTCQANTQKVTDWWREARADEGRLRAMVGRYREMCPPSQKGPRGKVPLLRFMEEFKAESAVHHLKRGKMMWKGYWMEFAQSTKGGKHTQDEAEKCGKSGRPTPITHAT